MIIPKKVSERSYNAKKMGVSSVTQKVKALKWELEGECYFDLYVFLIGFIRNTFNNETIIGEAQAVIKQ